MSILSCCQHSETFYLSNKYKHNKHHPDCRTMGRSQQDGKKNSSGTKVKLPKDDLAFLVETTNYNELEIK